MLIALLWVIFLWAMIGYQLIFFLFRIPLNQWLKFHSLMLLIFAILGFFHFIGKTPYISSEAGILFLALGNTLLFGTYFYQDKFQAKGLLLWVDTIMLNTYLFVFILLMMSLLNVELLTFTSDELAIITGIVSILIHLKVQYSYSRRRRLKEHKAQ